MDTDKAWLLLSNILAGEAENPKSVRSQGATRATQGHRVSGQKSRKWRGAGRGAITEQGLRGAENESDAFVLRGPNESARGCLLPLLKVS